MISGQDFIPNMEEVLAVDPDVVVQWADMADEVLQPIEQAGLRVVGLEYGTQEDLEPWTIASNATGYVCIDGQ